MTRMEYEIKEKEKYDTEQDFYKKVHPSGWMIFIGLLITAITCHFALEHELHIDALIKKIVIYLVELSEPIGMLIFPFIVVGCYLAMLMVCCWFLIGMGVVYYKKYSYYITLPQYEMALKKDINLRVFINDVFVRKVSKFHENKEIKVIDCDYDYKEFKVEDNEGKSFIIKEDELWIDYELKK